MLLVNEIRLPLGEGQMSAKTRAIDILGIKKDEVAQVQIARVSVDARHGAANLVYTVAVTLKDEIKENALSGARIVLAKKPRLILPKCTLGSVRPVVCGFGPAGIFAALILAQCGLRPIVLERGKAVEDRVKSVDEFCKTGVLDVNSNIQFGEGGAGTFSDGKLTTRIGDELCEYVKEILLKHGAPQEISYKQKPHIGTDLLRNIIKSIREEIIALGGEIRFNTQLNNIVLNNGEICKINTQNGEQECRALILAIGHSARDTFSMLQQTGLRLSVKPFSVGVRIEHLQSDINEALYHSAAGHPELPQGEYALSTHIGERCVYTFCMCPGGSVVAATSEKGGVVTNGMSVHARDGQNANAAVVVSVGEKDFDADVQKAMEFQARLEQAAFVSAGSNYKAPCQNMKSFMDNTSNLSITKVTPTYPLGVQNASLHNILGHELGNTLSAGLRVFNNKIKGFTEDAVLLTGVETRTSSPVRINRSENGQSVCAKGVYPAGEGAGYAGGIMSAAVDGIKAALNLMNNINGSKQ